MGLFNCDYHGDTGMTFVCSHIRRDIINRRSSNKIIQAAFPDTDEPDEKFKVDLELHYCSECVAENSFPSEDSVLPKEKFNNFYKNEGFGPACFKCFTELNSRER
jgi:hypothetical protein